MYSCSCPRLDILCMLSWLKFTTNSHDTAKPDRLGGSGSGWGGKEPSTPRSMLGQAEEVEKILWYSYKSTYSPAHVNHQQLVLCLQDLLGFAENCSNLTVYFRVGWISTVVFTEKKTSGICTRRKGNHDIIDASLSLASRNNHVYSDACWMLPLIPRQGVFSFLSIKRY